MSRSLALVWAGALVWTLVLLGCQAGPPAADPFQRPLVPPPSTGDITPIQPGMVSVPNAQPAPPVVSPGTGYAPPAGNYTFGAGAGSIYGAPPAGNQGAAPYVPQPPTYPVPRTQVPLNSTPQPSTAPYSYPAPVQQQPAAGSIYNRQSSFDRSVSAPARRGEASGTMNVARASYPGPVDDEPEVQPRRSTRGNGPADRGETYGFDPNYAWLHGKLEYSQVQSQWKLRYIALNGETDKYGGSVVLVGDAPLAAHKPGEFVSVSGAIAEQAGGQEGFAPTYRVDQIVKLSE